MIWRGISKTIPAGQSSYLVPSGQRRSDAPDAINDCLLAPMARRAREAEARHSGEGRINPQDCACSRSLPAL